MVLGEINLALVIAFSIQLIRLQTTVNVSNEIEYILFVLHLEFQEHPRTKNE
jgi:hypothetical protein